MDTNQEHNGGNQGAAIFYIILGIVIGYLYQGLSTLALIGRAGSGSGYDGSPLSTVATPVFMYSFSIVLILVGLIIIYLTAITQTEAIKKTLDRLVILPFYAFIIGGLLLWLVSLVDKFLL